MHRRILLSTEFLFMAVLIIIFRALMRGPGKGSIVIPAGDAELYQARDAFLREARRHGRRGR